MNDPDFKLLAKTFAWMFVVTCWIFYGLIIWVQFEHPHPQKDPITDFQEGLKDAHEHWGFSLFMLGAIVLYAVAWAYIREERENRKKTK
jgi:hypothetical protein